MKEKYKYTTRPIKTMKDVRNIVEQMKNKIKKDEKEMFIVIPPNIFYQYLKKFAKKL